MGMREKVSIKKAPERELFLFTDTYIPAEVPSIN